MFRPAYITSFLFLAVALLFGTGATSKQRAVPDLPQALATVAGESISAEEFRTRYIDYLLSTGFKDEFRYRSHFLNTLIAERLLVQEARAKGIEQEAEFGEATAQIQKKLLVEAYVQYRVYDRLEISEQELEETFVRANTTLEARHLFALTKKQADALHLRLMNGESFEALALEIFADTTLANNAGSVGSFTIDEMDPAFEETAFGLPVGAISKPVKTAQGYSIIQVTDRFTKPLITESEYAARRDKIEQFVSRRKKAKARSQLADELLVQLSPVFNDYVLERLLQQILGEERLPISAEEAAARDEEELVSFVVGDQRSTWTPGDFRDAASYTSEKQRMRVTGKAELEQFIQGLLVREEMVRQAQALGLDRSADFDAVYQRATQTWIWEESVARFTGAQKVPEDTIRAYFDEYGREFTVPERVRVWEILVASKAEALQIETALPDTPFNELASRHTLRPGGRNAGGDLGYLSHDQLGLLADDVFAARAGDILGPLEIAGRYALLKVGERLTGRPMTLEEARAEIENRLRGDIVKQNMKRKINTLRAAQHVEINEPLLAALSLKKNNE